MGRGAGDGSQFSGRSDGRGLEAIFETGPEVLALEGPAVATLEKEDGRLTVRLTEGAELDMSAAIEFRRVAALACWHAEGDPSLSLVFDLTEAKYLDSSGLAVLVDVRKRLRGRRIVLQSAAPSQVLTVLRLSRICCLFECEEVPQERKETL
jgi:anti-anti-sigma factor